MRDWKQLYRTDITIDYTPTVIDHFEHPRNVGRIEDDDGYGRIGDPSCGDMLDLTIRVDDKQQRIVDVRFLVFGCAAAVATSSIATVLAMNKTLDEAAALTDQDIVNALGGLPAHKIHCSLMSIRALHAALGDYHRRRRMLESGEIASKEEYRFTRDNDQPQWIAPPQTVEPRKD